MGARAEIKQKPRLVTKVDDRSTFQHIRVINGKQYFEAEFFRRYELQPFEVDLDTLDDDSDFISHLMTQLELHGWIEEFPLYYAVPNDPKIPQSEKEKIRGFIIDGRHRSWAWQLRWKARMHAPEPKPKPIPVMSVDHATIMRAVFELQHRSKNGTVVKRHAEKIITEQIKKHYREFKGDVKNAIDYFKKNQFPDENMVIRIYKKISVKEDGKENRRPTKRVGAENVYFNKFGGKIGTGTKSETENSLPSHETGVSIALNCPECKQGAICPSCMQPLYCLKKDDDIIEIRHVKEAAVSN